MVQTLHGLDADNVAGGRRRDTIERAPRVRSRHAVMADVAADDTECPFLARDDVRCAASFAVDRLDDFYGLCCGSYRRCATYHLLRRESASSPVSVDLTSDGKPLRVRANLP